MLRNCVQWVQHRCTYNNITMSTIQNITFFMYPFSSYVVRNFGEKLGWHDNVQ